MKYKLDEGLPDAARLAAAINAGDLYAVKAWVKEFGIDTKVNYRVPGARFDASICGTPLAIAIHQNLEKIALWLLNNGASQKLFSYNSDAGYSQALTYHPLGTAMARDMDNVIKLMLEQDVDFHAEQSIWYEDLDFPKVEVFGDVILNHEETRPLLERIGRLDLLEFLAKQDFRTAGEKQFSQERATA